MNIAESSLMVRSVSTKKDLLGEKMMGNHRLYGAVKNLVAWERRVFIMAVNPPQNNTVPCSRPQINWALLALAAPWY